MPITQAFGVLVGPYDSPEVTSVLSSTQKQMVSEKKNVLLLLTYIYTPEKENYFGGNKQI